MFMRFSKALKHGYQEDLVDEEGRQIGMAVQFVKNSE
jgi:hypothetical protein